MPIDPLGQSILDLKNKNILKQHYPKKSFNNLK